MNFLQRAISRAVTKAVNPDVFAFYFNKGFPHPRKINYAEAYTSWVFACVNAIASDTAKIELLSQRKTGSGWQIIPDTTYLQLLKKPNPIMTGMDLLASISSWKQIDGNAFLYVAYSLADKPIEIWPLDPTRMIILKDELKIVDGYNYLNMRGKLVPLKQQEVVHLKTFNPADAYRGIGAVEAARITIETDVFSTTWNKRLMENSATPESVLQTDRKLSSDVYARLKKSWNNEYRGVDNAHKLAILEEGLSLKPTQLSPKDADFLALRAFNRDEINAIFGVPKLRHGFIEGTNRASADTIEYVYIKNTILNEIMFIVDKLNSFYLPLWGIDSTKERIWFKNPVPDDEQLLMEKKNSGLQYGYYLINEVRAMDNLPPVEGGDQLYIPSLMQPLPATPEDDTPSSDNEPTEEDDTPEGKTLARKKAISQTFKEQQIAKGKKEMMEIHEQMKNHVLQKMGTKKAFKRSSKKQRLLSRLKDAVDGEADPGFPAIAADPALVDQALTDFTDVFTPILLSFLKAFIPDSFQRGGDDAVKATGIDGIFDIKNPNAQEWMDNRALKMATQIPETVKDDMAKILQDGIDQGKSVQDLASSVSGYFDEGADWRALRVARTEVITSYAHGSLEGAKQMGQTEKEWIVQGKGGDICSENQSQGWIPIEDEFASGDDAPTAHPNCECACDYR